MNYVIVAPPFLSTSAGVFGLHLLKTHLETAGQTCRIIELEGIGAFAPPNIDYPTNNDIVIIPDCFSGNVLKAKNVVRYLMMFAGYFGPHTDSNFSPTELMYYYSPEFLLNGRNPANILTIPMLNEIKFQYSNGPRSGSCYLAIKYQDYFGYKIEGLPADCIRIDRTTDLGSLFKTVKKLITFDNSAINLEAALAGVEVEYRFNEKFEKPFIYGDYFDYSDVPASYAEQKRLYFSEQLPNFITRTQEHFK